MTEAEYLKTLDDIGRVTYEKWIDYVTRSGEVSIHIMWTWKELPADKKQSYIEMGQAAAVHGLTPLNKRRQELIHKKNHEGGLTEKEEAIFEELDEVFGQCIDKIHPRSPLPEFSDHIKTLIKEMDNG